MILQQCADDINLIVNKAGYSDHFMLTVQVS